MATRTVRARVVVDGEDKYKQAMDGLSKSNQSMKASAGDLGTQVEQLSGKLGITLPKGATDALHGIEGLSSGSVAAMGAIAGGVALAIKAIKELNEMTLEAAAKADDLMTKSLQTGVSTDMLQQWQYASELIDVSVETMTGSMTKLTRNMAEASSGSGQAAEAFAALGVSVTNADGTLRNANDVMFEALASLAEMENQTERDAMSMEIFGKSAQDLNPLILNLDEAQRLWNEAMENGYVLSEDQLAILAEVDDAHQKFTMTLEKNRDLIALQWAPTTKEAYEQLAKLTEKAGKALIDSRLIENFGQLVNSLVDMFAAGSNLINALPGWLNPIKNFSVQLQGLAMVAATVSDALTIVAGLMPGNWGSGMVKTGLGLNMSNGQMSARQKLKYGGSEYSAWSYNSEIGAWNAGGTQNWRGGLTWVGEAGPELVALPRGSQIYSNQESRSMTGGNIYNITVANIEELNELLRWYDGLQIRGRMA